MKKKILRLTAHSLMLSFLYQLALPLSAVALTTGPSQPEVQSFEPVGTTDMVNMFSGDFTYNIPLLDVEGYPINISYHSGVTMEQEATWCGLGWNINPGEINRSVRGMPDDFNGERLEKELSIKPEKNVRVGTGANIGLELFGSDKLKLGLSAGLYVNSNNYKGMSAGMNTGVSVSTPVGGAGIDVGIGSQSGADVDVNASPSISGALSKDVSGSVSVGIGTGFNSRQGLKDLSFNISVSAAATQKDVTKQKKGADGKVENVTDKAKKVIKEDKSSGGSMSPYGSSVSIGLQNSVPVVTNQTMMNSFSFQIKGGGEFSMVFPSAFINASSSTLSYDDDGSRDSYGYLYLENAGEDDIMDFSRDKDGIYNRTLSNLPPSSNTYDLYSVSGQGTGGSFRPFRNDVGTFYDPVTKSKTNSDNIQFEFGVGNLFEIGSDFTFYDNVSESGAWEKIPFGGKKSGTLFEKVFFKAGGELTYNNQQDGSDLMSESPVSVKAGGQQYSSKYSGRTSNLPRTLGATNDRTARANLITYLTAAEASLKDVAQTQKLAYFADNGLGNSRFFDPVEQYADRFSSNDAEARPHHIGEFTQTLQDGRRYVYGLPAVNHMSRELTFSVDESGADLSTGLVTFSGGADDTKSNQKGRDKYYNSTATPSYAHSYMLTSVLSADYVDVLGDGPTDDDLGTFVKFNYKLWHNDYRWRAPYQSNLAQYNGGYLSDTKDGKGSYSVGSRQVWQVRSIESKNYIAEFYVSPRADGLGATGAVLPTNSSMQLPSGLNLKSAVSAASSYKLDSIKLFNKHDRYINEGAAAPIKTVIFKYDYSLCTGIPNTSNTGDGKLTLRELYIYYGTSEKSLLSPYVFKYLGANPAYNFAAKDRWGNYKPNNPALTNYEFPYSAQSGAGVTDAAAWNLTDIKLPSGGAIHVDYECKDYAYVQDRRADEMFLIEGFGSSPKRDRKNVLYEDRNVIYDYVYFKRDKSREVPGLTMRQNYLEGEDLLYYNFNLDITGNGRYEYVKGYARIEAVDQCSNDNDYGYVKLKRDDAGNMKLHPATVYGLNYARYYLPHILYPGQGDDGDLKNIVMGLVGAARELASIHKNPFGAFVDQRKARVTKLAKSWVRLQSPGLRKKGGGIRVKRLTLSDNWGQMTAGSTSTASYGKEYDYTTDGGKYGRISSGVASYEPQIGGDENPFRKPASSYQGSAGRLLPSIDFFQEEPFGENFFPAPVVGYSKVTVRSIHAAQARSAQAVDVHEYYTAKDFPLQVDYTQKDAPGQKVQRELRKTTKSEQVTQGYVLRFNDMHGKPRATNNYVVKTDGTNAELELITGTKYNYFTDGFNKLRSNVRALVRKRGDFNKFEIKDGVSLGREVDFSVDSRSNYFRSYERKVQLNLNATMYGIFFVPVPTAFFPDKEEINEFRMMVSTKIVQEYGIIKSVEQRDHQALTVQENLIFDSENGDVILSKVNNEYKDDVYSLKTPAYLCYTGMGPAYTNAGYEESDAYMIADARGVTLYPKSYAPFFRGDELLIRYNLPSGGGSMVEENVKVWVTELKYFDREGYKWNSKIGRDLPVHPGIDYSMRMHISPRYTRVGGNTVWPNWTNRINNVRIKVLRSGRRNMLQSTIEQTELAANPYQNSIDNLFGSAAVFSKVLSQSGTEYTGEAARYAKDSFGHVSYEDTLLDLQGNASLDRIGYNPYASGWLSAHKAYRQYSNYAPRNYQSNHARYDGTFAVPAAHWQSVYTYGDMEKAFSMVMALGQYVGIGYDVYGWASSISMIAGYGSFTTKSMITHFDAFGNALEEVNFVGNKSAAQYGYNGTQPAAVASNAGQSDFFFEDFESYAMLVPEGLRLLRFRSSYLFTPFARLFTQPATLSGTYSNANTPSGLVNTSSSMRRGGQNFNLLDPAVTQAGVTTMMLSAEASHTGKRSLKTLSSASVKVPVKRTDIMSSMPQYQLSDFYSGKTAANRYHVPINRKCRINLWIKPVSGTGVQHQCSISFNGSTVNLYPKSSNIDGWYLLEGQINFTGYNPPSSGGIPDLTINLPSGAYVDDIRMIPVDASMKSFVYDPYTFKLVGQLDENHMASFYEYDQEGLLVRTKKETVQGIRTLTESRRANMKQDY